MNDHRSISIIINTDGRARSLEVTLNSLRYLKYPKFEVCVVHGPTLDGTAELLERWRGRIKIAGCAEQNLGRSRNIGIALSAGDIVAFLDDDAVPEPEWLDDLAHGYRKADVGACGGFVYDHTGVKFQWRYGTVDRLARANLSWLRPTPEFNFPFSYNVPHLLGTNCSLRRQAVMAVGGFDEEFDYFLDETDILFRLNDAGWKIEQVEGAFVHHKVQPSHYRSETRVIKAWYSIVKNKIYLSLLNAPRHHSLQQAFREAAVYIDGLGKNVDSALSGGHLGEQDKRRFDDDVQRAWQEGLRRGLSGRRRLVSPELLSQYATPFFLNFAPIIPVEQRRTICFLSQDYPPDGIGGIARYVDQLARATAARGHHVHVLTRGRDADTVDFENGVWIHRIVTGSQPPPTMPVPKHIWDYSATMLAEAKRIATHRTVDAVVAPIWDCEGLAFLLDGRFRLVTSLQTTLKFLLESNGHRKDDQEFALSFIKPMLATEQLLFERSTGVVAISNAIAREIEEGYGVRFQESQLAVVPIGLEDWTEFKWEAAAELPPGTVRILFVGRLEERKGIDVLLAAIKQVMSDHPEAYVDIVGNDELIGKDNMTYRELFEGDRTADTIRDRVFFHGQVSEAALRGFYRACDIFVAPSRFESFGLILVEAMMFGKPVIGSLAGGMVEVVEHGKSGLLAKPGDAESLTALLGQLVENADLRRRLGLAGRQRYEKLFTPERMAEGVLEFISRLSHGQDFDESAARVASRGR